MTAFFAGMLLGSVPTAAVFAGYLARLRRGKSEIPVWTEQHYQPTVTTRVLIKERIVDL